MPHHIFLVDDEEAVRLILTDLFESRGYRITEAVDGADPFTVKSAGRTVAPSAALLRVTVIVVALMGTSIAPLEGFEAVDLKKSATVN